jgi:lysozyme family protein
MTELNSARFDICWPHVLIEECPQPDNWSNAVNFSNDPADPGGATMCGIIQTEYNFYRAKNNLKLQSVRNITRQEGHDIYYNNYWLPHCPVLPIGLDLQFFDECVNTGPVEAVKVLQVALVIQADGVWGPQTMAAVGSIKNLQAINAAYEARRELVYHMIPNFGRFGRGWEARASTIGHVATEMVA